MLDLEVRKRKLRRMEPENFEPNVNSELDDLHYNDTRVTSDRKDPGTSTASSMVGSRSSTPKSADFGVTGFQLDGNQRLITDLCYRK